MSVADARKKETLRAMAHTLKRYLYLVEKKGIPITPSNLKVIMKCPDWLIVLIFRGMLRSKMVADSMLGNHTVTITKEILKLDKDFLASL
jgi:2-dehydropantoate 2-reductase